MSASVGGLQATSTTPSVAEVATTEAPVITGTSLTMVAQSGEEATDGPDPGHRATAR